MVFKLYKFKVFHVFFVQPGLILGGIRFFSDTTKAITTNSNIYNRAGSYEGKSILLVCLDNVFF
jgi:hypothetical protein